jgi:plastocyanin
MRVDLTSIAAIAIAAVALAVAISGRDSAPAVATEGEVREMGGGESPPTSVSVAPFAPKGHTIAIQDFAYDPDPVRVRAGQAVVWENFDTAIHTVTAADGNWDSGNLSQGEAVVLLFSEPGTYQYICTLHPPRTALTGPTDERFVGGGGHGMRGTVIVD